MKQKTIYYLLQQIFFVLTLLIVQINNGYEYPKPVQGYYSQKGQDKFLNENIFKNKTHGCFVEIGAHDGISFSNTYFFEKYLNWTGVCIEPNPDIFFKLKNNRKCICEQVCISNKTESNTFLKCTGYITEMYSGLVKNYDPRHLKRINDEISIYGGNKETILIDCISINTLFKKYNIQNIDLLSIDIEGGEEHIIKDIDFNKIKIKVVLIEDNFNENKVKDFLICKGYKFITRIGKDDIYKLEAYE